MTGKVAALVCAVAALLATASPVRSEDRTAEVNRWVRVLSVSADPVERVTAVSKLAEIGAESVPRHLAKVVRRDESAAVRLAAAVALGTTPHPSAEEELLALVPDGGTRDVRRGLARSLEARGVTPERLFREMDGRDMDDVGRERVLDALAVYASPLAAGYLEQAATTGAPSLRPAAIRALWDHPVGRKIAPTVLVQALAQSADLDETLDEIEIAMRVGCEELHDLDLPLRARKVPQIDRALDEALAWIDWRASLRKASAEEPAQPATRFREDRVFVLHRGRDLARSLAQVKDAFARADAGRVDLRVSVYAYREVSNRTVRSDVTALRFTRDPARVEDFFGTLTTQVRQPNGTGMAMAVEDALDRPAWRWEAERSVVLVADAKPLDGRRVEVAPGVHFGADAVRFGVVYMQTTRTDEDPIPASLTKAAAAGGGTVLVLPPVTPGILGK